MSYYVRGDPGLGSFVKRLVKKAPQIAAGFATGGYYGAAAAAFQKTGQFGPISTRGTPQPAAVRGPMPYYASALPIYTGAARTVPSILKKLPPIIGGGLAGKEIADIAGITTPGAVCCPPGYHPAKDGSGRCVRNRRMNVCNPKALRRSIRRLSGFEKLAKRTLKATSHVRVRRKK